MNRPGRAEYFATILAAVAARSTCLRRRVGAVVVDERWVILGTGYNGVPRGLPHCGERDKSGVFACQGAGDAKGDTRRCWAVHAEVNALLQCSDLERARTIFVSATPCFECAKAIANTGITLVCAMEKYADELGLDVLWRRGIVVSTWNPDLKEFTYVP